MFFYEHRNLLLLPLIITDWLVTQRQGHTIQVVCDNDHVGGGDKWVSTVANGAHWGYIRTCIEALYCLTAVKPMGADDIVTGLGTLVNLIQTYS